MSLTFYPRPVSHLCIDTKNKRMSYIKLFVHKCPIKFKCVRICKTQWHWRIFLRYETKIDWTNFLYKLIKFTVLVIIKVWSCFGDKKTTKYVCAWTEKLLNMCDKMWNYFVFILCTTNRKPFLGCLNMFIPYINMYNTLWLKNYTTLIEFLL